MMLAISTPSISEPDKPYSMPGGTEDQIDNHWELSHLPTSKLLVINLSTMLFTQVSDLHPLFYPFGPIKDIKIVGSSSLGPGMDTTITAMVEYVNISSAQEAKEALQFQSYVGHPIEVHYVCDALTPTHARPSPFLSMSLGHGKPFDVGLNPFAAPFNIGARMCTPTDQLYNPRYGPKAVPSGLPGDVPFAPQAFPAHTRPFVSDAISRSSSATSSG